MALDEFIAGRYSGSYDSVDVGITSQGYDLGIESRWESIDESDAYGLSLIDGVFRGGNVTLQFESKAFKAGSIAPFWPWGALGVLYTPTAPISRLASAVASAIVLSATADTPAASSPATLTGPASILAPNNPARLLYNSKLRHVPVRLALLPTDNTGTGTHFTTT